MKLDTKKRILEVAQQLFNAHGYNEVSLGDIAKELNISKGNLTYHFKKKEEIVEAILGEVPADPFPQTPATIEELNNFFLHIQEVVTEYAFYFWHYTQLAQLSPQIHEKQRIIYQNNVKKLSDSFLYLYEKNMFRAEKYPGEYLRTIDSLLLLSIFWPPFCTLKQEAALKVDFQRQAWSVIYPIFTDMGRGELRKNISEI